MSACLVGSCARVDALDMGDDAKSFTLKDIEGKEVRLSEFKGKAIILNFFAPWCPPCRAEIPDFIDLQKAYGPSGLTFIGVSLVNEKESRDYATQAGINYPILVDDGKASDIYGPVRSIPTTYVISRNFKIAKKYIGARSKREFEAEIKEILK
jgi:cytochrome c biogenesis protein CcmG/thiol:disulfide interchange protein DsbE